MVFFKVDFNTNCNCFLFIVTNNKKANIISQITVNMNATV